MTEELLQFIWKFQLYRPEELKTSEGELIEVLHPGHSNQDSGPDFFNAKIKLANTLWAGNVEVHLKSSDWYRHKHQENTAYDNVILHVVLENDIKVENKKGQNIPALQLSVHSNLLSQYSILMKDEKWLACKMGIKQMESIQLTNWLEKLVVMKLEAKNELIMKLLTEYGGDWDQVLFIMISRSVGLNVNGAAFENVARSIPIKVLLHHSNNQLQVESLLMGQAGLLDSDSNDAHLLDLKREYHFLKEKYQLKIPLGNTCRFMRLRPSNFPTIRLSQLAYFICQTKGQFEIFLNHEKVKSVIEMLSLKVSEYWKNHYTFGNPSKQKSEKIMGQATCQLMIINSIIPILFAYGNYKGREELKDRAIKWLDELPAERNQIVDKWDEISGVKSNSAFDSQGVVYLKNNFCILKKCLVCAIGHQVLNKQKN